MSRQPNYLLGVEQGAAVRITEAAANKITAVKQDVTVRFPKNVTYDEAVVEAPRKVVTGNSGEGGDDDAFGRYAFYVCLFMLVIYMLLYGGLAARGMLTVSVPHPSSDTPEAQAATMPERWAARMGMLGTEWASAAKVFTLDPCLHAARLLQFSSIVPVARQFFAERAHSVRFIFAECAAQAKTFRTEWDARVDLFSPEWAARAEAFTTGCDSAQLPVGQIWARRAFRLEVCYRTNAKV